MSLSILRTVEPVRGALRERLPDVSQVDLPSLELAGRRADETVDRLRGRSRRPGLGWLAGVIAVAGIAIVAASVVLTRSRVRRAHWSGDALEGMDRMSEAEPMEGPDLGASTDLPAAIGHTTGLTAAEGSVLSYDPVDGDA